MSEPRWEVITLGETMLRLSPPGVARLGQPDALTLTARVGGSESNTAAGLSALGDRVAWLSRLPDNPLGRWVEREVASWGADTSLVRWAGEEERLGLYFLEFGAAPRPTAAIYDRADSAAARMQPHDWDWAFLAQARHLHLTGITPALSGSAYATVKRALAEAQARRLSVSFDVNYRARLWPPDVARDGLSPLLAGVDLLFCSARDARTVFGLEGDAVRLAAGLQERFGARRVVTSDGADPVAVRDGVAAFSVPAVPVPQVVDRLGAGDALAAGAIHGLLAGDVREGVRFGVAMAALALTMPGDALRATRREIEAAAASPTGDLRR